MISLIRDYLDVLSGILNISDCSGAESSNHLFLHSYFEIVKVTLLFFGQSLIHFFEYLITFGWFRDIMYLPIILPKYQQFVLSERFFYEDLNVEFFNHLSDSSNGLFGACILGFLNSLFCCLPLSTTHLLAIRRLFVQGMVAGVASTAGIVLGQCGFIFCTVFGIRAMIIPWFSWDPLNYIVGLILLLSVVYEMSNEKRIRPIEISEQQTLRNIFIMSILLTWTEQANISQYLTNVTLSNQPSILTFGGTGLALPDFAYCIGILLGHICFSGLFIGLSVVVKNGLFTLSKLPYSVWLKRVNSAFLVVIIGLSFSSTPYYSFDYLLAGPLGFLSQDKLLDSSIFSQRNTQDPSRLLTSMDIVFPFSIDTDISYFDRGDYGEQPGFFQRNYEELNYQGEYAWLVRRDKKPNLYSSAQTTRTKIRDLFQLDQNLTDSTTDPLENGVQKVSNGTSYQGTFNNFPQRDVNKIVFRDRLKVKKRYEENYDESRANETFLMGESFNNFPQMDVSLAPLETTLKQKYYANIVYKTLLNVEIDAFLKREPNSYKLTPEEENAVFRKRYLLAKYHDTIRAYQELPYRDEFNEFFQGSKSFVDRAYHHQFKGNLGTLTRLFAVTFDGGNSDAILKYDQPLLLDNTPSKASMQWMHEELSFGDESKRFDFMDLKETANKDTVQTSPLLEPQDSTPFYLGWDNEKRQMILTKRFVPQLANNIDLDLQKVTNKEFYSFLKATNSDLPNERTLTFTKWPLKKDKVLEVKSKPNNQAVTLFEPTTNPEMLSILKIVSASRGGNVEIYSFPTNMRFFNKTPERLAPNQGGLVWPGSQY